MQNTKEKIIKGNTDKFCINIFNFLTQKSTINKINDKGLISTLYKELIWINKKKKYFNIKMGKRHIQEIHKRKKHNWLITEYFNLFCSCQWYAGAYMRPHIDSFEVKVMMRIFTSWNSTEAAYQVFFFLLGVLVAKLLPVYYCVHSVTLFHLDLFQLHLKILKSS